jgi:hypothetical protein
VKENDLGVESVTNTALGLNSVASENVVDNDLAGADIDEDGLGSVPNADAAENADLLDNKDSAAFQEVGSEGWTPLPINQAAFPVGCNWTAVPGFATPSYFRDRDGLVHLRGVVKANDGNSINCAPATQFDQSIVLIGGLPAGHTPENRSLFTVTSNNKPGRVDIFANGVVLAENNYPTIADSKVNLSLDGITYRCGPSGASGCP